MIRISGEPYFNHVSAVAELAEQAAPFGYEVGLCHDLLEDLQLSADSLRESLLAFGYPEADADVITATVVELTDVYTAEAYPDWSKKERKQKEAARLSHSSPLAQTVKYADLIYNIAWTLRYEPHKAFKYLRKKKKQLRALDRGDPALHKQVMNMVKTGLGSVN